MFLQFLFTLTFQAKQEEFLALHKHAPGSSQSHPLQKWNYRIGSSDVLTDGSLCRVSSTATLITCSLEDLPALADNQDPPQYIYY